MFSSVKILLAAMVDYAGIFPPAKLSLKKAIANYARYHQSSDSWLLGRFIIPVSRLAELETLIADVPLIPWSLSVILSKNWQEELKHILNINNQDRIAIASLEFKPLPPEEIKRAIDILPKGIESFFEIPLDENLEQYLSALRDTKALAKIRTGGLTADAFPNLDVLCRFIFASAQAQIPFKATAGLHHPLPGKYPVSYEPNSLATTMQGFLNLSILTALVDGQKINQSEALTVLQESSLNNFQFQEDKIAWKDHYLNLAEIQKTRQYFFRSFGSCSFQEPIDELRELQLL